MILLFENDINLPNFMSFNYKIREFWQFKRILTWNSPYKNLNILIQFSRTVGIL